MTTLRSSLAGRTRRHALAVGLAAAIALLPTDVLPAQADTTPVPEAARVRGERSAGRKSPMVAAGLGLVLPGSGHWYAGEQMRGWIVAAVYWSGVAVVHSGRTDAVGQVGGVALLGALGVSIVDGACAAGRRNARVTVTPGPDGVGPRGGAGGFRMQVAVPW